MPNLHAKLMSLLTPKRRWAQFRLRSLFVLVAIAAVPCAWLAWKMEHWRREQKAITALTELGGMVYYHDQFKREDFRNYSNRKPPGPQWVRRLFGDDFFANVAVVRLSQEMRDADIAQLRTMPRLREIIGWSSITDSGLTNICQISTLKRLDLHHAKITDSGLRQLCGLPRLESLFLENLGVSDAGLVHVKGMKSLRELGLHYCKISDAGLAHLDGLIELRDLYLYGTSVTDAGVAELQKALPNCRIYR
jgi:hypothetical protein